MRPLLQSDGAYASTWKQTDQPMKNYPLLDVRVSAPSLELHAATDDLLDELAELVRAGKTEADPAPYDDPMSFYETDPDLRVAKWLRAIWRRRGAVEPDAWRLYFVVMVDGRPVGEQTLLGVNFSTLGTVITFSWLSADERGRGLGHEMRAAILHLAFHGLGAKEASSDAFVDNYGSNAISHGLGYEPTMGLTGRPGKASRPCSTVGDLPETTGNDDAETTSSSTTSRPVTPSCRCPDSIQRRHGLLGECPQLGAVSLPRHAAACRPVSLVRLPNGTRLGPSTTGQNRYYPRSVRQEARRNASMVAGTTTTIAGSRPVSPTRSVTTCGGWARLSRRRDAQVLREYLHALVAAEPPSWSWDQCCAASMTSCAPRPVPAATNRSRPWTANATSGSWTPSTSSWLPRH
jgi:RimJ/RimL family protein N-acetyltransferase